MDSESFKQEAADYLAATVRDRFAERYEEAVKKCESEIERILYAAMIAQIYELDWWRFLPSEGGLPVDHAKLLCPWVQKYPRFGCVSIHPQTLIGNYRVDFFVHFLGDSGASSGAVIECDGHDYHDLTKKQASRDRKRDRVLQDLGYRVLRFTGSDICRDPFGCAEEVWKIWNDFNLSEMALADPERHRGWRSWTWAGES